MVTPAQSTDFQKVAAFLAAAKLPTSDLPAGLPHFFVALEGGELAATAGVEIFGEIALLRSVAVAPAQRGSGLGAAILRTTIAHAQAKGATSIWLITDSAAGYFEKHGFRAVERSAAPPEIAGTAQFAGLCPSSAVVMKMG
ncbi:MAG: arsenic resistance N-acetyltransferase ArsN2 [Saprospiraceae bacterium]